MVPADSTASSAKNQANVRITPPAVRLAVNLVSFEFDEELPQPAPAAKQEPRHRFFRSAELMGDLVHRLSPQVTADDDVALILRQLFDRRGQAQQQFSALGLLTG